MIKQILVPTDGSEHATIGAQYGIGLAKQHDASLIGLHIIDIRLLEGPFLRDISASLGTAPYVNYQNNIAAILEERGKATLEDFRKRCEQAGVEFQGLQITGPVMQTIVTQSELADLVVVGRGVEQGQWIEGLLGSTTENVVRHTKRPVLVTGRREAMIRRFIVAYDGSPHARSALQFATSVGEAWLVPFEVLTIARDGGGDRIIEEARQYLDAHDLAVEYTIRDGDPRETLVDFARERDADLLVMGAFGHSKVRELLLGSTTHYVLNHAPCPVLLAR
jgi:nucleotide-binding universal stress UspA family protein